MANIEEVSGVFGGVKVGETEQGQTANASGIGAQNAISIDGTPTTGNASGIGVQNAINIGDTTTQNVGTNLPTKRGFWDKVKAVLFYEIKVELTPYEQKVEDEINEFLHQEITWGKVKDFLFQDITFGKKKKVE